MKTVTATTQVQGLSEIGQNNKTEFSLCRYDTRKKSIIQCHQFVHCRDFMLDAFVGAQEDKDMGIYGFRYSKEDPRIDPENTSLLLRLENDGALKNFQSNFSILKDIEDHLGWEVTFPDIVEFPDTKKSIVVWVLGDASWQKSALSFSLYTYLLKCLTYPIKDKTKWMEEIQKFGGVESHYMDPKYLNFLFTNMNDILLQYKNFSGWKKQATTPVGNIHNSSGFVSMKKLLFEKDPHNSLSDHVLFGYKVAA